MIVQWLRKKNVIKSNEGLPVELASVISIMMLSYSTVVQFQIWCMLNKKKSLFENLCTCEHYAN